MKAGALAALVVLPVLLHAHLRVTVAGSTVTVAMSWLIPAVMLAVLAAVVTVAVLALRNNRGSPHPRPRLAEATAGYARTPAR